jgi:hypothetical protein
MQGERERRGLQLPQHRQDCKQLILTYISKDKRKQGEGKEGVRECGREVVDDAEAGERGSGGGGHALGARGGECGQEDKKGVAGVNGGGLGGDGEGEVGRERGVVWCGNEVG